MVLWRNLATQGREFTKQREVSFFRLFIPGLSDRPSTGPAFSLRLPSANCFFSCTYFLLTSGNVIFRLGTVIYKGYKSPFFFLFFLNYLITAPNDNVNTSWCDKCKIDLPWVKNVLSCHEGSGWIRTTYVCACEWRYANHERDGKGETRERGRRTGLFVQREVFTYKSEGSRLSQFIKVMRTSTVFYSLFICSIWFSTTE